MIPLYLIGEPASEAAHADWMRDRGRAGFDARQFREHVGRAAEGFAAAAEAAGAVIRRLAVAFSRAADEFGRGIEATGRPAT